MLNMWKGFQSLAKFTAIYTFVSQSHCSIFREKSPKAGKYT